MKRRLFSVFFILALVGGVFAGLPLHAENSRMAKCCAKAKSKDRTPEANAARMCCALNCTSPSPSPSSSSQSNFAPTLTLAADPVLDRIAELLQSRRVQPATDLFRARPQKWLSQPRYIQHHSILI